MNAKVELTEREREVLLRICSGLANKEIAQDLGCALKTVECHVSSILRKAGLASRLQLAVSEHLRRRGFSDPEADTSIGHELCRSSRTVSVVPPIS